MLDPMADPSDARGDQRGDETGEETLRDRAVRRNVPPSAMLPPAPQRPSRRGRGESVQDRAARRTVSASAPPPAFPSRPPNGPAPSERGAPAAERLATRTAPDVSRGEAAAGPAAPPRGRLVFASLLGLLVLLAGAFLLGRLSGREPVVEVQIPVVRGEDLSTATNALQELGLRTVLAPAVYDSQIPRNAVISSNPPAGATVQSGSVATVTYSNGPEPVTVPPLVGQPEETARDALEQVGLAPGLRAEEPSAQVAAGSVVRLEPAAGSDVAPFTTVTLVISAGAPPVVLPRVIGLEEDEAQSQLTVSGLEVEIERQADADVPEGRVIDQSPASGTIASPGTAVVLTVSTG